MINLVLVLFVAVVNVFLGFLVFSRNAKKLSNIFFASMALSLSAWSVVSYYEDEVTSLKIAKILVNVDFALALLMAFFFLMFGVFFLNNYSKKKIINYALAIITLVFVGMSLVGLVITGVTPSVGGGLEFQIGNIFYPYTTIVVSYLLFGILILISKYRKAVGNSKNQLKFVMYGLSLSAIIAVTTNLIIPRFIDTTPEVTRIGIYGFLFFTGLTSYAIARHRLMDIRMVVARSVSYSLLVLILAGFYAGAVLGLQALLFEESSSALNITESAVRTAIAVIMVFLFQPLRRWLNKATDKIFFKNQYDMNELLGKMTHTVSSTIILIEMMYKTVDLLVGEMKISRGILVATSESGGVLESQSIGYKKAPKVDIKDIETLTRDGILVLDELSENSKFKKILQKYDVSVCIPIKRDSEVEGLLLLGEKQSGDMYSQNDLKVFEIIGPEIAVGVTNAKSYEKIEKFTITLRQEVKKATAELQRKNEQLRELDKAKDEFISMASHQLRTPLTAIKGYLSMLLEGDAGEIRVSQYDFVNEAFQGANRMVGLINDLLNVSRMETGRFFLEPSEVDLGKVVEEEVKQITKQAKEKGLKLEIKIGKNIPKVWVDETKMRQVIMNFADNAVYYTTKGGVTVSLESDKTHIVYKVVDTGIGVPKEQQKNLFTKFYRADNARHVRPDGTGLGIYLAKRVMDDHGGELIFNSVEGKGSTFGFKIPKKTKLKMKKVSAPQPRSHITKPEIGELAAGVGIDPKVLEATEKAGVEHPLTDSTDKKDLEKEVKKSK